MRIPRPVKLGFLTALAVAFCCKQCLHDPLAATGEDLLSAQQAEIELEKLGIAPDAYSQKQLEAATAGDVKLLRLLLATQPGRILIDEQNNTAMHLAAREGKLEACRLLTQLHQTLNYTNAQGQSPLHLAAAHGHTECLLLLLESGSSADKSDMSGYTPLMYAAEAGHKACVEILLARGASINVHTIDERTIMQLAEPHPECLALLQERERQELEQQKKLEEEIAKRRELLLPTLGIYSAEPLFNAIIAGNPNEVARLLLEGGISPNAKTHQQIPAVMLAAQHNQPACLKMLLEYGAEPNVATLTEDTALHAAIAAASVPCTEILLKHGANVKARKHGDSALSLAVKNNLPEIARLILRAGADPDEKNSVGETPLCSAAKAGHIELLKILIEAGANVHTVANSTSAHLMAAASGKYEAIKILLKAGANIFYIPPHQRSILHQAAENNHTECMRILLAAGADPNAEDSRGDTPLHYAAVRGNASGVSMLIENGANIERRNKREQTPLILAAMKGHADCVAALIANDAYMETATPNGNTPMHYAAKNNHGRVLEVMIKAGADMTIPNYEGETPMDVVQKKNNVQVQKITALAILELRGIHEVTPELLRETALKEDMELLSLLLQTGVHVPSALVIETARIGKEYALTSLLRAGGDPQAKNEQGNTALHIAAAAGKEQTVKVLINHHARIAYRNNKGKTPRQHAAEAGKSNTARLIAIAENLMEKGITSTQYGDALIHAAEKGDHGQIAHLLEIGTSPVYHKADGQTPLHAAARNKNVTAVKHLLQAGANPNVKNAAGNTALMEAAQAGQSAPMRALIQAGAHVNIRGATDSAITYAVKQQHVECVQILLDSGADVDSRDTNDCCLVYLALMNKNSRILDILLRRGATVKTSCNGEPLLHTAIRQGSISDMQTLIKADSSIIYSESARGDGAMQVAAQIGNLKGMIVLAKAGIPLNVRDKEGRTLMHHAAENGHVEILNQLIQAKQNIRAKDNRNRTPLEYAERAEQQECVEILKKAAEDMIRR